MMNEYEMKLDKVHRLWKDYMREMDYDDRLDYEMETNEELSRRVEEFYEKYSVLEREYEELKSWYRHITYR